jgi:tight adherence protein B
VGLTRAETAALCVGAALLSRFIVAIALPEASRGLLRASNRHSDRLREEFVLLPAARIFAALLAAGAMCTMTVLALSGSAGVALVSGAAPALLAGTVIRWHRARRRQRIVSQLPIFLNLVAGHVKAGHSLAESLAETVPMLPAGIREEMGWLLQKVRLGASLGSTLAEWEARIPAEEISLLVRPLRTALPGGGNIVDLLEQTCGILRRRIRSREKLRALTAQARLQAVVLTLLAPSFAAVLSVMDPGFFRNLVGTEPGKGLLLLAATLEAIGWITIRKILAVRP